MSLTVADPTLRSFAAWSKIESNPVAAADTSSVRVFNDRLELSNEAKTAISTGSSDTSPAPQAQSVTTVDPIIVTAVRKDWFEHMQTLKKFGPLTPQQESQAAVFYNQRMAIGQTATDLVHKALSIDGVDLNDPAQKAVYIKFWMTSFSQPTLR